MAQDTLSRVNKKMGANRACLRQKVSVPVLIAWVLLLAYGAFVIWTASLTIAEASFTRQLVGIGLGLFLAFLCWRSDFSGLAGMTTVLLVIDLIVLLEPLYPRPLLQRQGHDRMDQDPAYRTHLPAGRARQAHHDLLLRPRSVRSTTVASIR